MESVRTLLIVNPAALRRTIEGNVCQGLSRSIHEEVAFNEGMVTSTDWQSYPILDISEDDKEYIIKAELPDVKKDDIKLNVHDDVLTITAVNKIVADPSRDTVISRQSRDRVIPVAARK